MKCSFCGNKLKLGTGKMFVMKSGSTIFFCSKKCEKNWNMGRDSKKIKWTKLFRKK